MNRRHFLTGTGAALGTFALGASRFLRFAHGEPTRAPTRLLIVHKPIGTVPDQYDCAGDGRDFTLSPILAPFADLRGHMTVIDGLDIMKAPNTPFEDHGNGMVTFMTGGTVFKPATSDVAMAERASIDQLLARLPGFAGDAPIRSLQVAADTRSTQLMTRTLSYVGRGAPMPPEQRPFASYARVFGTLADPGLAGAELAHARARQQSVLDFSRAGLSRIAPRLGAPERERLDRHLQAIRETEQLLDRTINFDSSQLEASVRAVDPTLLDAQHGTIGGAHLAIIRAAFQCDLTRIATFGWASGQSSVNFSRLIPGVEDLGFHSISHGGHNRDRDEAAVHRWYNERLAEFLRSLRDTPDVDGRTLLDNTLVVVWSEMRLGTHTFENVPIQLFGGAGGRLRGGKLVRAGKRPTNDLWLAVANAFGHTMTSFGDAERCTGALPGVFEPSRLQDAGPTTR